VADKVHAAQRLAGKYGVETVPAMVVDGKYLTSGSMAPDHRAMLRTVDHLIQKARRERSAR
jgi:thiol:disulfide interchange protein DsbA